MDSTSKKAAHAAWVTGTSAQLVSVHAEHGAGCGMKINGIAKDCASEARVRVRSALAHGQLSWPCGAIVHVQPDEPRRGAANLDLAIAIALHATTTPKLAQPIGDTLFAGELSMAGTIRPTRGIVPQLLAARARGIGSAVVPLDHLNPEPEPTPKPATHEGAGRGATSNHRARASSPAPSSHF